MSSGITFAGLGSGTDFSAMVDELRKVEEFRINNMNKDAASWEMKIDGIDVVLKQMDKLKDVVDDLSDLDDLIKATGSSSNESSVGATANSDSAEGSFSIDVLQLASAGIMSSKTKFQEKDATIGDGKFSYTYGDTTIDLTDQITDETTIEDLVKMINNDADNPGVKASLIQTADGYVFQMQGEETGAENTLDISTDLSSLGVNTPASASAQLEKNDGSAVDKDFALGLDKFSFSYAGKDHEFNLDGTESAEDIVKLINENPDNPGVTASVKNGALVIEDNKFGTSQIDMTFEHASPGNPLIQNASTINASENGWNKKEAQNAEYVLNGFDDQVLTSSTNSIENVVEGVTMELKNVTATRNDVTGEITGEPTTVTIGRDSSELVEKVEEWVTAVNDLRKTIQDLTEVDSEGYTIETDSEDDDSDDSDKKDKNIGSPLTGNTTLQRFQTEFNNIIGSTAFGFDGNDEDVFSHLGALGIKTETEGDDAGLLVIDEEILKKAVEDNATAVADLLGADRTEVDSQYFTETNSLDTVKPGNYDVTYNASKKDANGIMEVFIDGHLATYDEKSGNYTLLEKTSDAYGMSITFGAPKKNTDGTYEQYLPAGLRGSTTDQSDSVRVIQGKSHELSQFLEEESKYVEGGEDNSSLQMMMHSYQDIVDNLDLKIEDEIARLDLWEERQRLKYARLDASLGVLNQQMSANAAALGSLNPA